MTPKDPTLPPELQALDNAYAAFKEATAQLEQKLESCLHARGPWPTDADYKVWTDAVDALRNAGQGLRGNVADSHAE